MQPSQKDLMLLGSALIPTPEYSQDECATDFPRPFTLLFDEEKF
jgi:hypothetical protein